MQQINSYNELLERLKTKNNQKILLHTCCGPCSSTCIELLEQGFDIDIYYSNPNIDTKEEFEKRSTEQIRIAGILNKNIQVIVDSYDNNLFNEAIKGKEYLGEKSIRCYECYKLRMERTCLYAKEHGYDYWTTSLSISPHKNSDWINEIGKILEEKYQMPFIYSNFKLKDGFKRSIELSKQYDLYRQNYCGCHYSKIERGIINE